MSESANSFALKTCAVGLTCILDDQKAMMRSYLRDRFEVCRPAIEVHGNDCASSLRDRLFDLLRVYVRGCRINVGKDWSCSRINDRLDGRDKRVRCGDDLIARTNAGREQGKMQGTRSRVHPDAMPHSTVIGKGLLEPLDFLAEDEGCLVADPINGGADLVTKIAVLRRQVEIRDLEIDLGRNHSYTLSHVMSQNRSGYLLRRS